MTEPSYTPLAWADSPDTSTPIDAANLAHVENGVKAATDRAVASVRHDQAQSLPAANQAIGRGNLGLGDIATHAASEFTSRSGSKPVGQGELTFNIKDYGAKGDGSTDDTSAITSAINAAAAVFGEVFIPPSANHYVFTNLTIPQGVTLRGAGYKCIANAAFGYSGFVSGTDRPVGSVLRSTVTTGQAITFSSSNGYGPFYMRNLAVVGPGSGTSTGITLGESTTATNVRSYLCNVLVCNFSVGWNLIGCEDSTFDTLRSTGCSTGFTSSNYFNQNDLRDIEVQYSSADGLVLSGTANVVTGVLAQNCSGNSAIQVPASSPGNTIISPYLENCTATDSIQLKSETTVQGGKITSNCNPVHVVSGANGCYFEHVYANVALTIDSGIAYTTVVRSPFTSITRNGSDVIEISSRVGGLRGPIVSVGNDGPWQFERTDAQSALRLKDTVNSHYAADIYPSATDSGTLVWFHGAVASGVSATASRPNAANFTSSVRWYDTDKGIPIWGNGSTWADANGVITPLATKTASYNMVKGDGVIVANGATVTISLPDPTTVNQGRVYTVKNINAAACTVNSQGTSKTIDGAASASLAQWGYARYVSDGTQWLSV